MNTTTETITSPTTTGPEAINPGGGAHTTRAHIALGVSDLAASLRFYEALFDAPPTRVEADYAKLELADPPLHLSLNLTASTQPPALPAHFGVQVASRADVLRARLRLEEAGLASTMQERSTCCYAVQDKLWASDPDGHRWEVFVTFAGATDARDRSSDAAGEPCCPSPQAG